MKRKAIGGLLVAAMSLSAFFLFSFRGSAGQVPSPAASRPDNPPAAGTSFAGAVSASLLRPDADYPAVEPQNITLEPSSPSALRAAVSFALGSYRYKAGPVAYTMDVAPFVRDTRVYLPLFYMGLAIGMTADDIAWDPATRTVALHFDGHTATFTLGSPVCTVDGAPRTMKAAPLIVSGRMAVPPGYFAAAFGYRVVRNLGVVFAPGQDPAPGDVFVVVDTTIPEQLFVCRGSSVILATYCNTGVPEAPTPIGVFHVFAKLTSDTMSGKNPDGSSYYDPGVPWVLYFDGGCAIHGFVRARYGFPQSVGCVELPVATARKVYGLVPVGSTVYIR